MSKEFVFVIKELSKSYGTNKVFENIWLSFYPGAKIGVIGPNGAGKSSILKIMAGVDKEFDGEAWPAEGTKIGYLPQEPQLDASKNVFENIMESLGERKKLVEKFNEVSARFAEEMSDDEMNALIAEQAELQEQIDTTNAWDIEREIDIAMDALNCPPKDADVSKLSGGEKRRVALAKLLLEKPDMLLLDEPTNHLDAESVWWLQKFLADYPGTVVMITHDRYFLDNVTGWILEMDRGQGIPHEGNYTSWLEAKAKRMQVEESQEKARQKAISEELEWVRQGPKARQSKSKARLKAFDELVKNAGTKTLENAQIVIPQGPRLGDVVLEAKNISKSFGDRQLIKDLSFNLPPGGIVGIVGPNGAGKTTLFKLITGQETVDSGDFKVGDTVKMGYIDQSRDALDDKKNVWENISGGSEVINLGSREVKSRAYVSSFNFKKDSQQQLVGNLSGGQRNRVHLARMLKEGVNLLLLDEPTNDLDVETLRALEEALLDFAGCAVVISHDRYFLDRIATHILAYEGDGHVEWFEGNFEDYLEDKKRRLGDDYLAEQNRKFKKIA